MLCWVGARDQEQQKEGKQTSPCYIYYKFSSDAAAGINGYLLLLRHPKSGMCVCVQHLLVIVPLHKHLSNFIFFQGTRQIISLVMIMREQCSKNFTGSSNHIRLGFLAIMFLMVHTYILIST
jgi:hypothetical protein